MDERTIALRFTTTAAEAADLPPDVQPLTATCDDLPRVNIFVTHSKTLASTFRDFVDHEAPNGDSPSLDDWLKAYQDAHLPSLERSYNDLAMSGSYTLTDVSRDQDQRLVPTDGSGAALMLVQVNESVDSLIEGDTNVLLDVPIDQRAGLRSLANPNARNFQIAEVPGRESLVVLLNLANPARPLPGFHPETGEPLDQGKHPILSDVRVRRALQLAIDQNAIIDGILQRSAEPLSGLFPPGSWAYDSTLPSAETNIEAAKQMLDEAGWIDRGSGRYCVDCQTAPEGTPLQFTLGSSNGDYAIASEIARQWGQIGAVVILSGENTYALAGQTFDAYLVSVGGEAYEDADPDRSLMLSPAGDILNPNAAPESQILNYGSYNNPAVTDLLARARTLPGCDPAARADLYHQLERLLQQDLPFLPVAAPNEFYAAAPNVLGFAPRTGDPLWNIASWVVSP